MKQTDLRAKVLKHLYTNIPFYKDLSREKKNELYDAMMKVFAEEAFCDEHNITDKQITESGSSVYYCGQIVEFSDKAGADNFIADMYELSMCCCEF